MRDWLIAARKARGISQKDMSRSVRVSQPSYWAYERGTSRPRPAIAKNIASILGFDWTRFYDDPPAQLPLRDKGNTWLKSNYSV